MEVKNTNLISVDTYMRRIRLSKDLPYFIFVVFSLLISFRVLLISSFSTFFGYIELIYIVLLGIYTLKRIVVRALSRYLFINNWQVYLFIILLLPFFAAYASHKEFGQPLLYGIIAFKQFYLIINALVIFHLLKTRLITIELVEKAFIYAAWFNLIYFFLMSTFTDAAQYQDTLLAGAQSAKGDTVYFNFNMAFIFFGTIYYFVKSFLNNKPFYLIYSLLFLIYIVFYRLDRSSMLVVAAGMVTFYILYVRPKYQILNIFKFILPGILFLLTIYLIKPEIFVTYSEMFSDLLDTILGNAKSRSQSSLRLHEYNIAVEYINKNPYIGNGVISNSWKEGGFNYFFDFFYPADVGLAGQIFIYGIIGAFLLYAQYIFVFVIIIKLKKYKMPLFYISLVFYLMCLFLDTLSNGFITTFSAQTITVITLIYFYYKLNIIKQLKNK